MKMFLTQLKWQFVLLHKNNVINISLAVTFIYGLILFLLNDMEYLDMLLISLVLNDPSVIGYFFIALVVTTEIKHQILSVVFVSPINLHHYLLSKVVSLSVIGTVCSLGLIIAMKGLDFGILPYAAGSLGICLLSALLGVIMLTYAPEFLKFGMLSIPVFLVFINLPLLDYLGAINLGFIKYIFPIQGGLELLRLSINGADNLQSHLFGYASLAIWVPVFYAFAFRLFNTKIVHR